MWEIARTQDPSLMLENPLVSMPVSKVDYDVKTYVALLFRKKLVLRSREVGLVEVSFCVFVVYSVFEHCDFASLPSFILAILVICQ